MASGTPKPSCAPHLLKKTLTPHFIIPADQFYPEIGKPSYGLAQFTSTFGGHHITWHLGYLPGHQSMLLLAPDEGIGMTVMTNDDTLGKGCG